MKLVSGRDWSVLCSVYEVAMFVYDMKVLRRMPIIYSGEVFC